MLARVKQDYTAGPVRAFSGREYVRTEWREVPAGFEEEARTHPLLDTQPSLDEIRAESPQLPGLGNPEAETQESVTAETPEPPAQAPVPVPLPVEPEGEADVTAETQPEESANSESQPQAETPPSADEVRDENAQLPGLGTSTAETPASESPVEPPADKPKTTRGRTPRNK